MERVSLGVIGRDRVGKPRCVPVSPGHAAQPDVGRRGWLRAHTHTAGRRFRPEPGACQRRGSEPGRIRRTVDGSVVGLEDVLHSTAGVGLMIGETVLIAGGPPFSGLAAAVQAPAVPAHASSAHWEIQNQHQSRPDVERSRGSSSRNHATVRYDQPLNLTYSESRQAETSSR
jgi:hypothetical protein